MKTLTRLSLAISALIPFAAFAQGGIKPVTPNEKIDLQEIINNVAGWATGLLIAISVLFVIYAAFMYMTAAGDTEKVKSTQNIIIYAVVGIVIALLAQVAKTIAFAVINRSM